MTVEPGTEHLNFVINAPVGSEWLRHTLPVLPAGDLRARLFNTRRRAVKKPTASRELFSSFPPDNAAPARCRLLSVMSEHDTAKLEADDAISELVLRLAAITSRAEELRLHLLNLITAEEFAISATRQLLDSTHD